MSPTTVASVLHFLITPAKDGEGASGGPGDWDVRIVYPDGTAKVVNQNDRDGLVALGREILPHREHVQPNGDACAGWLNQWFWPLVEAAVAQDAPAPTPAPAPEPTADPAPAPAPASEWPEAVRDRVKAVSACDDLGKLDALRKADSRSTVVRAVENRMAELVYPDAPYTARERAAWVGSQTDPAVIRAMLAAGTEYGLAENRPTVTKAAQERLESLTAAAHPGDDADPFLTAAGLHKTAKGLADWVATQTDSAGIERLMKADTRRTVKDACRDRIVALAYAGNPGWPLVAGGPRDVEPLIKASEDIAALTAALEIEQGEHGKARKTVVAALTARISEVSDLTAAPAPEPEPAPAPAPEDTAGTAHADAVKTLLAGKVAEVKARVASVSDLILLRAARLAATRKGDIAALDARIADCEDEIRKAAEVEDEDGNPIVAPAGDLGTTDTEDVRPEIAGDIEGGGGMNELGGGIEGGGLGGELGGGLGSGMNELGGGLGSSEDPDEISGGGRTGNADAHHREGAGCKQPAQVLADQGVYPGQVLAVAKNHRQNGWGRCDYTVKVEEDCTFRLIGFNGTRETWTEGGDRRIEAERINGKPTGKDGQRWAYSSEMFWDLLGIERGPSGKGVSHHKQTLRRYFKLEKTQQ